MNPLVRKYKQFKYRDRSKDSIRMMKCVISVYCLLLIDSILDVAITGYPLHERMRLAPILPAAIQIFVFIEVWRHKKSLEWEEKIREKADDYYVEEVRSGYVDVDLVGYKDYINQKLYLAYPLSEWTPKWETI